MTDKDFIYKVFLDSMSAVMKLNIEEDTVSFLKTTNNDIQLGQTYCYSEHWENVIQSGMILEDDIERFRKEANIEALRARAERKETGEVLNFRFAKNGVIYWARLFFNVPDDYSKENPFVLLTRRDLKGDESENQRILLAIDEKGHKIIASNTNQLTTIVMGEKVNLSDLMKQFTIRAFSCLMSVTSFFVRSYNDFFVVDLEHDEYFSLKIDQTVLDGKNELTGNYSSSVLSAINERYGPEGVAIFENIDSPEKLRNLLKNRSSIEYKFTDTNGEEAALHITKIESYKSEPIRALLRINHQSYEKKLKVRTFGNFEVYDSQGNVLKFTRNKSKQVLAFLIDKQGYKVSTRELVMEVLEKDENDRNAIKYVSTLIKGAISDLEKAGYTNVIAKERNSFGINVDVIDCEYYRLLRGDISELDNYHNEYMKEYSWAEDTNAELMNYEL